MADDTKSGGESFNLDRLKQLIRLMEKHDLSEVKLQGGDEKWVLRRGPRGLSPYPPPTHPISGIPVPMAPPQVAAPQPEAGGSPAVDTDYVQIKSPTVGTFYQSPQPGEPPFVKVGDTVRPDTTVCIIEAMKVFNQIPAEVHGTVAKVLVNDGDAVEFGQPLFQVKPA